MASAAEASLIEEVITLLKRVDDDISAEVYEGAADALKLLAGINMTVAVLSKTKAGIRVGKLREHSHSKVADAAKACVLIWKAVAAKDGLTGRSVGSINSSGASSAVQVSNGSSSLSQPSPSPTAAADSPALQSDAASARSGAAPVARLAAARQRPLDALCKCVAETMTKHFGTEDGQTDLAVLGLPVPTPEQIKEQADSQGKVLEAAIFSKHGGSSSDSPSAGYTEQVKLLALNLRRNVAICTQFFFGMYSAEALAKITAEEIASSAAKAAMEQALKDGAEAVQLDWKSKNKSAMLASAGLSGNSTGMLTCPRCRSKKTDYYQMQTRSADEPMTTFANCEECGHKWRFC